MARVDNLNNFLTDVATVIRAKTRKQGNITPANFDTEIEDIETDVSDCIDNEINSINNDSVGKWAWLVKKIPEITYIDANITNLDSYFLRCQSDVITFSNSFDTSNVTNMGSMFFTCEKITSLDLTMFDTSNVTNMSNMFIGCKKCSSFDVSSFDTRKVTTMNGMFNSCYALTSLDISNFETPLLTNTSLMFNWCPNLQHIDMRGFDFTGISSYTSMFGNNMSGANVPNNCEIIVADQTQKAWFTTNFSRLTNIKTVAEYEAE